MQTGLRGQTALITGGASGIGQSIAIALASEGVRVYIADQAEANETLEMIQRSGGQGNSAIVDLRSEEEIASLVSKVITDFGGLDLFVNVAGVYAAQSLTQITLDVWQDVLSTNVTACALASREVAKHMISRRKGSILIVGSTVVCAPSYQGAAYRASKTALRSFMETSAIELAPFGIRVNMLTPGPFPTGLVRDLPEDQRIAASREVVLEQREGRLEEVRGAAVFLLSDTLASYITGTEVYVDGGLHLRPLYIGSPEVVEGLNRGFVRGLNTEEEDTEYETLRSLRQTTPRARLRAGDR